MDASGLGPCILDDTWNYSAIQRSLGQAVSYCLSETTAPHGRYHRLSSMYWSNLEVAQTSCTSTDEPKKWYMFGYSIAFSPPGYSPADGQISFWGSSDGVFFRKVFASPVGNENGPKIPELVYALFQGMFAAFTYVEPFMEVGYFDCLTWKLKTLQRLPGSRSYGSEVSPSSVSFVHISLVNFGLRCNRKVDLALARLVT